MFSHSQRASAFGPALVIFFGVALRLIMLQVDVRFHPDEALFAAQARLISDDLLLRTTDLDKPPLTFYVTALSFRLFGPTEVAARLPNLLFSSLSLLLFFLLVEALYQDRLAAASAALLWAISPYDLAFAATAFTDIQATFWVLAACLLAVRDRWRAAGIAAALAFAAKTNVVLFIPLIVILGIARRTEPGWRRVWRFLWPLALGSGALCLWDASRAPRSFFSLGYTRNNPGRLIRSDELWPRLEQWGHWLQFIAGSPLLSAVLFIAILIGLGQGLRQRSRSAALDWLIAGFALAFLSWHWLIAFNTYDRYLHTLVPFLIVLAARALTGWWSGQRAWRPVALIGITACLMIPAVITCLQGKSRIGGDQGQHTGIDTLADTLNTELSGQIVYDHWLGWELAYYLGDEPRVSMRYAALPEALAEGMTQQTQPCYFVAPSPQEAAPWLEALRRARIEISIIYSDFKHRFVIYRLSADPN
jgi:4-amino-4-deoxy-L-arabinose transferase-like glycosyltransferase